MSHIRDIIKSFKCKDTLWSINRVWWREEAENRFTIVYSFSTDETYLPYIVCDLIDKKILGRFEIKEPAQDLKNKLVNRFIMFRLMEAKAIRDKHNPKKK